MRISSKSRYALAAMINMAQSVETGKYTTVISISDKFGISKIYLEQVFSLLKKSGLVISVKGSQGGYQLSKPPAEITAYDILQATEIAFFDKTEETVADVSPEIENAVRTMIYEPLNQTIINLLKNITLLDLVNEAEKNSDESGFMFYI